MSKTAWQWLGRSFLVVATAHLAACADESTVGPDRPLETAATAFTATAPSADALRAPDLAPCPNLEILARSPFRLYARGVQIYHWNGSTWSFDGPSADLSHDPAGKRTVGTHYAGPTWETRNGSKVVGTVFAACSPDPDAIPWLLLAAESTGGPGLFERVVWIQRVNTAGGKAPAHPGSFTGQEAGAVHDGVSLLPAVAGRGAGAPRVFISHHAPVPDSGW